MDVKYFFICNLIKSKDVETKYCPTDFMLADYFTKPLSGKKFERFWNSIMGIN
jgi:hypothetical protein